VIHESPPVATGGFFLTTRTHITTHHSLFLFSLPTPPQLLINSGGGARRHRRVSLMVTCSLRYATQAALDRWCSARHAVRRQLVGDEAISSRQVAAGHHGRHLSKCGAKASRMTRRARCSPLLTAATLSPGSRRSPVGQPFRRRPARHVAIDSGNSRCVLDKLLRSWSRAGVLGIRGQRRTGPAWNGLLRSSPTGRTRGAPRDGLAFADRPGRVTVHDAATWERPTRRGTCELA